MLKVKDYIKGCKECVYSVDTALREGVVLSKEERFDYYFKTLVVYREDVKKLFVSKLYRAAEFYAKVLLELRKIEMGGYDNAFALHSFKKVNRLSMLLNGVHSNSIEGYDEDGKLFIIVEDVKDDQYEITYEISDRDSLMHALCGFAEHLISNSCNSKGFINKYLSGVLSEIENGSTPQPYSNTSETKTLSFVLAKNSITPKVPYLRILDENAYRQNRNSILMSENSDIGLRQVL